MHRDQLPAKRLTAWLSTALIPTMAQLLGGENWLNVLLISVLCAAANYAVWKWGVPIRNPWLLGMQYLFIIIITAQLLPYSAKCWPGDPAPAVPLILLALAAWSAWKGAGDAAKVGCVLLWTVLGVFLLLLAIGMANADLQWLHPAQMAIPWQGAILLLPCAAIQLCRRDENWNSGMLLPSGFCVLAALAVGGVLSPAIARCVENPVYFMTKNLNVMGSALRFEAVLSAVMTTGWFSLICILLTLGGEYMESAGGKNRRTGIVIMAATAAAAVLLKLHISWWILGISAALFWVFLPLLTQGLGAIKKS